MPDYQELHDAIVELSVSAARVQLSGSAPSPAEDELAEVCGLGEAVGALSAALAPEPEPEPPADEPKPEPDPPEPEPKAAQPPARSRRGS